jgi:hypothetical protein
MLVSCVSAPPGNDPCVDSTGSDAIVGRIFVCGRSNCQSGWDALTPHSGRDHHQEVGAGRHLREDRRLWRMVRLM